MNRGVQSQYKKTNNLHQTLAGKKYDCHRREKWEKRTKIYGIWTINYYLSFGLSFIASNALQLFISVRFIFVGILRNKKQMIVQNHQFNR